MAETFLNPLVDNTYSYTPITWSWSNARDAANATSVDTTSETLRASIIENSVLRRAYLEFDLSSITDTITKIELFLYSSQLDGEFPQEFNIVYGGSGSLRNNLSEYSLYLDKIATVDKTLVPLSTLPVTSLNTYNSCSLDIINYPTSSTYVVGLVCKPDFLNDVNVYQNQLVVSSIDNRRSNQHPYLKVTHGGSGYPNIVMGVTVTSVMGIPAGNIANIMGV